MARRVAAVLSSMRRNRSAPTAVLNMAAAPCSYGTAATMGRITQRLLSRHPVQVLPKISTFNQELDLQLMNPEEFYHATDSHQRG